MSVTCTGLPVRVIRFILSGSRTSVRRVIVFMCQTPRADSCCVNLLGQQRSRLTVPKPKNKAEAKISGYVLISMMRMLSNLI